MSFRTKLLLVVLLTIFASVSVVAYAVTHYTQADLTIRNANFVGRLQTDFAYVNMTIDHTYVDDHFALEGREVTATFRSLCVFTKKDGRWLWAAGQTMRPSQS